MKKIPTLLAALTLASAAPAWSADLMSVYRAAMDYDATFASARAAVVAGREKLPQGRAGLLPQVGISANTLWNDLEVTRRTSPSVETPFKYNTNGWTASLTQPLFRWQNWETYNQGELQVAAAEAQFELARQDLILRTAQAYFDVLLAEETLASTQAQKTAIGQQLESAKRNFEVGTATITDTHEAQARYDLAVAAELAADNDLAVKRQNLRVIVGQDTPGMKKLRVGVQMAAPQPADAGSWSSSAEGENYGVRAAQAGFEIAVREVRKQRAGHLPTLDLVATRGRSSATNSTLTGIGTDTTATTVGLQLSMPIFAGGLTASKDRETVALRDKAAADLDNAKRTAGLQARQAYLGVTSGLAQVKAYEAALASSKLAVDSNKLGYEVGVRINIDVLNAESQLYDTRQKLAKARFDTLMAQLKLKGAAGSLAEDDLKAVNALLE